MYFNIYEFTTFFPGILSEEDVQGINRLLWRKTNKIKLTVVFYWIEINSKYKNWNIHNSNILIVIRKYNFGFKNRHIQLLGYI